MLDPVENPLSADQTRRAMALTIARTILINDETHTGAYNTTKIPKHVCASDLVELAEWIVNGADPTSGYTVPSI